MSIYVVPTPAESQIDLGSPKGGDGYAVTLMGNSALSLIRCESFAILTAYLPDYLIMAIVSLPDFHNLPHAMTKIAETSWKPKLSAN